MTQALALKLQRQAFDQRDDRTQRDVAIWTLGPGQPGYKDAEIRLRKKARANLEAKLEHSKGDP